MHTPHSRAQKITPLPALAPASSVSHRRATLAWLLPPLNLVLGRLTKGLTPSSSKFCPRKAYLGMAASLLQVAHRQAVHVSTALLQCLLQFISFFVSFALSFCVSFFLSLCLSFFLSFPPSFSLSFFLSLFLSVFLSFCLSFFLSVVLSFCLSFFLSVVLSFFLSFLSLFSIASFYPCLLLS